VVGNRSLFSSNLTSSFTSYCSSPMLPRFLYATLLNASLFCFFSRIHPGRCIGFIEEETKMAGTTPKGYPIQTQHTVYNTTHTDQTTRARPVPSTAKNGEEAIHRASKPRHNQGELHETDSNSGRHKPTHYLPICA
jgi:hypothetical protein